ncbi:unnamed protein product, partial [Notodromas monacha]
MAENWPDLSSVTNTTAGCLLCGDDESMDESWSTVSDEFNGKTYKSLLLQACGRKDLGEISDVADLCPQCCGKLGEYSVILSRLENLSSDLKISLLGRHPGLAENDCKDRRARVVVTEDLKTMMIRARLLSGMDESVSLRKRARCDTPTKDCQSLVPVSSCVFQDIKNLGKSGFPRKCSSSVELGLRRDAKDAKPRFRSVVTISAENNIRKKTENNLLGSRPTLSVIVIWDGPSETRADWTWQTFVPPDMSVGKLKQTALAHFLEKSEALKAENSYKLLFPENGRRLLESNSVADETGISDGNQSPMEMILFKVGDLSSTENKEKPEDAAPTSPEIERATATVPRENIERMTQLPPLIDVQMRRVFLTLLETSCKLQSDDPIVLNLLKQTLERVRKKCKDLPQVDKNKLGQLLELGFSTVRAVRALRMFRQNLRQATDWLLLHPMSTDDHLRSGRGNRSASPTDNVGAEVREASPARNGVVSQETPRTVTDEISVQTLQASVSPGDFVFSPPDMDTPDLDPFVSSSLTYSVPALPTGPVSTTEVPEKPWNVLLDEVKQALREFHRLHFIPHHGVMQALIEMGFNEEDAEIALQVTGNKREPACEWLLAGNKAPGAAYETGFPRECPIILNILEQTPVQLALMKPKTVA